MGSFGFLKIQTLIFYKIFMAPNLPPFPVFQVGHVEAYRQEVCTYIDTLLPLIVNRSYDLTKDFDKIAHVSYNEEKK